MSKIALIVDDSRLACKIMSNMLETMDIQSVEVYSAEEALDYLQHHKPDMIFLDQTMPGMDGLQTIKVIKSNPITATIPVLMYTAKQGEVYVGQARALGAVDVLPKGMEKDYLLQALTKLGFVSAKMSSEGEPVFTERRVTSETALKEDIHEQLLKGDSKSPTLDAEPGWKSFWRQEVEPFLNRQKKSHVNVIQYSSRLQTRKIIKEIYQTLEQFEHALISRIQAQQDFKEATDIAHKNSGQKRMLLIAALIIIFQMGIFWQLFKGNHLDESLKKIQAGQENLTNHVNEQLSEIDNKLTILKKSTTDATEQLPLNKIIPSVALINDFGDVVVENLYLSDSEQDTYLGVTAKGYQIVVNQQGEVGLPLENRYFFNDDCHGNAFVESNKAMVFRGNRGEIWYVDKFALETTVTVGSILNTADECSVDTDEVLNLRLLERDFQVETGIDESHIMRLLFR